MMRIILLLFLVYHQLLATARQPLPAPPAGPAPISLAGDWQFALDPDSIGEAQQWYQKSFTTKIKLPGSTDEGKYGTHTSGPDHGVLSREWKYVGPAWFIREIEIPAGWKDREVELFLERVLWESKVWIDGKPAGIQQSLSTPHIHSLGKLAPGKHRLAIRVNNSMIYNIGDKGHIYSEYTQSIWNGIIGRIALNPRPAVAIQQLSVYPDAAARQVEIHLEIADPSQRSASLTVEITDLKTGKSLQRQQISKPLSPTMTLQVRLNFQPILWDEFNPQLYRVDVTLQEEPPADTETAVFGFRKLSTSRSKILVNDRPVFLRGNLDCVHFPLTGYPSMEAGDWERIFRIYQSYGLNHVRFHSWCPPEAAFEAADKLGIYIMVDIVWIDAWMTNTPKDRPDMYTQGLPNGLGKNPSADRFVQDEMERISRTYGNHPSFMMFCIGNELGNSDFDIMEGWIRKLREKDGRRLYSVSTARKITATDQYNVTHHIPGIGNTYGIQSPGTDHDLEKNYGAADIPIIAHEVGQFPVYPLWSEIEKYTGVLKPRNLEACYALARKKGVAGDALRFHLASGSIQQLLYKELIENIFRTPSAAGFQLLSLQDYQGQGEALVGWLDAFYDSKGITDPETFRMHCNTLVPLARFPKYVWKKDEVFTARALLANYGAETLNSRLSWQLLTAKGSVVQKGELPLREFQQGMLNEAGQIEIPLSQVPHPGKYVLELVLEGSVARNRWDVWVYDNTVPRPNSGKVLETTVLDSAHLEALARGESVLLYASRSARPEKSVPIHFRPVFWSTVFFPGQGFSTLGSAVDSSHPALADFPTDSYTGWQWETISKGRGIVLNDFPPALHPIVQPISDFHINDRLGSLLECRVGKGRLMICGYELDTTQIVARQLRHSLLNYMSSRKFDPSVAVPTATLLDCISFTENAQARQPAKEEDNTLLHIYAGANATGTELPGAHTDQRDSNLPPEISLHLHPVSWNKNYDRQSATRSTDYSVGKMAGIWKKGDVSGWSGRRIEIKLQVPQGVIGELYVHLFDPRQGTGDVTMLLEGRSFVSPSPGTGKWISLFVMREDTNDGEVTLVLDAAPGGYLGVSELILREK